MTLLNRYLFTKICMACGIVSISLIFVVWLTQSLRLIDFWLNRGVPFETFLKLVLFVLPDLVVIVLPIALLIGLIFVFSRLLNDQELIVMRASGFSDRQLAKPALWVALGVFSILYCVNLYILPASFKEFRSLETQLRSTIRASMIVPGEFNNFRGITVFVRERSAQGELKGILIHDARDIQRPFTLMAQRGQVLESPEGAVLVLKKGIRQETENEKNRQSLMQFDEYMVRISGESIKTQDRILKPYEMSLSQLFFPTAKETGYNPLKLQAEAHQRLLMPFLSFVFTIIVTLIFLRGDFNRRGRSKRILHIMGSCFLIEMGTMIFIHIGEKHIIGILGAYVTVLSSLIIGAFSLWHGAPPKGLLKDSHDQ